MRVDVLDRGHVRHVESWGCGDSQMLECAIIEAARQSTQGAFRGWETDEKLLRYLYSHKHSTPFEFVGMTLEIQAPIMVIREWQRHRTQGFSETSARYAPLPDRSYMPTVERCLIVDAKNTQANAAAGSTALTHESALEWLEELDDFYEDSERVYKSGLARGVPKEVARLAVCVGRYTKMWATANLRNWLAFLTLRMAPEAQWEIRQFANAVGAIIAWQFPRTWKLFEADSTFDCRHIQTVAVRLQGK